MKKTLVSALTTALVVGAASTTFAAANPFTDVPANHWAYDAVYQLAADGIVNGYADGKFMGDENMTRYEMAQIVAKALAHRTAAPATDKAMIDKLAAEFSDELSNLGVRVANLEKKVDNVKWGGEVWYEFASEKADGEDRANTNRLVLRLEPSMKVNEKWTLKSRIETSFDANSGMNSVPGYASAGNNYTKVEFAYAEGELKDGLTVRLGRMPYVTNVDAGMVMDSEFTGAQIEAGKVLKVVASAGRYSLNKDGGNVEDGPMPLQPSYGNTTATYAGVEAFGEIGKWTLGVGYHSLANKDYFSDAIGKDKNQIYTAGIKYAFTDKLNLGAAYAKSNSEVEVSDQKKAYSIQLAYGEADPGTKGSYGVFAAYRLLGETAAIAPTWDGTIGGAKGWHVGGSYTFLKNTVGTIEYFNGKKLDGGDKANRFFGKLDFLF